jgi:hypothetical protein
MARPPKLQAPTSIKRGAIYPGGVDVLLGCEDDASLSWHVSRKEILDKVRTIEGIADLAKVSKRTVRRSHIPPNSRQAIQFVRDRRREIWRPLVSSGDPLDWRNLTTRYIAAVGMIVQLRRSKGTPDEIVGLKDPEPAKNKLWHRKERIRHYSRVATREEAEEARKRLPYHYAMGEKISVTQLCSALRISRRGFNKWLRTVPIKQRKLLRTLMLKHPIWPTERDWDEVADVPSLAYSDQRLDVNDLSFGFSVLTPPC